jgi:hypothetical protein
MAYTKLHAALAHVVLADRQIHESGNLKSIIQDKVIEDVLELADCWYKLPFTNDGKEDVRKAIDMGRDAREKTIYRTHYNSYYIYFIGSESDISARLSALKDAVTDSDNTDSTTPTTTEPAAKMSDNTMSNS